MAMFTDQELASMTPAEQETARAMNAAEAAGKDPFDDDLDDELDTDETDSEGGTTDETDKEEIPGDKIDEAASDDKPADKPAEEPAAAAAEEPAAEADPEPVLEFKAEAPADADAKLAELRKQRLDARKKWSAGEIDEEELEALEAPIEQAMDAIRQQQSVAAAMEQANKQLQAKQQADAERAARVTVNRIRAEGTAAGLDYSPPSENKPAGEHAVEFDRQLQPLLADPKWQAKGFDAIAAEAHRKVMLLAGKAPAAAPAARRAPPPAPQTLRDVPAADRANAGSDLDDQFKTVTGLSAQKLWDKLTPAQQARMLDE